MTQSRLHRLLRRTSTRSPWSVARSIARSVFLCTISAAVAAPLASAQLTEVWTDRFTPPGFLQSVHQATKPYPDGGTAALILSSELGLGGGSRQFEVRTLDRNGDQLWSTPVPITTLNFGILSDTLAVDPATGAVAVMGRQGPDLLVHHFAPDGSLSWVFTMVSVLPNHPLTAVDFGFTASGDVLVAGYQDDGATFMIPRASVASIHGATGLQSWRQDFSGVLRVGAECSPHGCHVFHFSVDPPVGTATGYLVTELDTTGAFVSSFPVLSNASLLGPRSIWVQPDGSVLTLNERSLELFDSAGARQWRVTAPPDFYGLAPTGTGDFIIRGSDRLYRILGSNGATAWTHPAPAGIGTYADVIALPGGRICAGSRLVSPGSTHAAALEVIDAAGHTVTLRTFTDVALPFARFGDLDLDESGNVLGGLTMLNSAGYPREARTLQVVVGPDPSQSYCAPAVPNSTGSPAVLSTAGSAVIGDDNVSLVMTSLPQGATVFGLASLSQGLVLNAGGSQGHLCLGGLIGRYVGPGQVRQADVAGAASLRLNLQEMPTPTGLRPAVAGETWYAQAWYRDANPTSTSNFTNGVALTFH